MSQLSSTQQAVFSTTGSKEKLIEIESVLSSQPQHPQYSLYAGQAGIAVFYWEYYKFTKNEEYLNKCFTAIEACIEALSEVQLIYTFCSGISGILWAINYLQKENALDTEDIQPLLDEAEDLCFKSSILDLEKNSYDFMHAGLSPVFFISEKPTEKQKEYLQQVVTLLLKNSEQMDENSIAWKNSDYSKEYSRDGEYNFGLSHGIPSIICALVKIYQLGVEQETCKKLITGSINFILKYESKAETLSLYPTTVYLDGSNEEPTYNSRLGWCYGDFCIANVLYYAGKGLNNDAWLQKGITILQHAAKKRDVAENAVNDAGICHGAGGAAHIFNKYYQLTGEEAFKEAAIYWYEDTLNKASHADGLAGYKAFHGKEGWITDTALLEGIAGIGLALLSGQDSNPSKWDECLLIP